MRPVRDAPALLGSDALAATTAIRMLVLDVDGVLTDGSIVYGPGGEAWQRFHVRDGFGVKLWKQMGGAVAVISGRSSPATHHRLLELGVDHVELGVRGAATGGKAEAMRRLREHSGVPFEQMAALGDDWPDAPMLAMCGYAMAVADAEPVIKGLARWTTARAGGHGAVRDAVEHLIERNGQLLQAMAMAGIATA